MIHVQMPVSRPLRVRATMDTLYFRTKESVRDRYGDRLFKHKPDSEFVICIVLDAGKIKGGRPRAYGIHKLRFITFLSNYGYDKGKNLVETSQKEWDEIFLNTAAELYK